MFSCSSLSMLFRSAAAVLICLSFATHATANTQTDFPLSRHDLSEDALLNQIVIKLHEETSIRIRNGSLSNDPPDRIPPTMTRSMLELELNSIESLIQRRGYTVERLFTSLSESQLDVLVGRGESASGKNLKDLNLFYSISLAEDTIFSDIHDLVSILNAHDIVDIAYAEPVDFPASIEIKQQSAPLFSLITTPDFEHMQGYLDVAPAGINARYAWGIEGGKGASVKVIDIEGAWNTGHEDLPVFFYDSGNHLPSTATTNWVEHGTAVVGVLAASDNGFGVTGIVSEASLGVQSIGGGVGVANSIILAASVAEPGGLILIEIHRLGPEVNSSCACGSRCNYIAVEYWEADFAAIEAATANGVIVVEAAGNGSSNLDLPQYGGAFDRTIRDSGAIIVGASQSGSGYPTCWTNHGSRVDMHGWGSSVTTTGYGTLFSGDGNVDRYYTSGFSGTSSASPIVTGAAASIQGISIAAQEAMLSPEQMRTLLTSTGTPQSGDLVRNIGPLPNLEIAIANMPVGEISIHGDHQFPWLPAIYNLILH